MPLPSIPEYSNSIKTPALVHPEILRNGKPIEKGVRLVKYSGGFCVVFPFQTNNKKYAVRCWHAEVSNAKKRTQIIADALKSSKLPYFVGFEYFEDGIMTSAGLQPIVVMDWVEAQPLKKFLAENIADSEKVNKVAENFKKMVADLHQVNFSHGDLQHGNIMVKQDCSIILVDYDSMFVPALKGMPDEIKGLPGYQHEARWNNPYVTEKADYFSELIIYISLIALSKYPGIWQALKIEDTETLLFSLEDLKSKGNSPIFELLREDSDLVPMIEVLREYLSFTSLEELQPLEKVLISKVDSISSKWKGGNGHKQPTSTGEIDDPCNIAGKWAKGNGYSAKEKEISTNNNLVTEISNKFKKKE